jgi:hypothetical protein
MNIKAIFMLPILVALGAGFTTTIANTFTYMLGDPGSIFLLVVMVTMLVAIVSSLYKAIFSMFGG